VSHGFDGGRVDLVLVTGTEAAGAADCGRLSGADQLEGEVAVRIEVMGLQ
jgi:hypothetical protein